MDQHGDTIGEGLSEFTTLELAKNEIARLRKILRARDEFENERVSSPSRKYSSPDNIRRSESKDSPKLKKSKGHENRTRKSNFGNRVELLRKDAPNLRRQSDPTNSTTQRRAHRNSPQSARKAPKAPMTDKNDKCTRQNVDKRSSRYINRRNFSAAIQRWQERHTSQTEASETEIIPCHDDPNVEQVVRVYIRKRPLFDEEKARGQFDVVTVSEEEHRVNVHNCLMHADLKRMYLKTMSFPCSACFPDTASNDDVYMQTAAPLVRHVAIMGGVGTLFMYGQTGSGKTHTMGAIEERGMHQLFQDIEAGTRLHGGRGVRGEDRSQDGHRIYATFFELAGKKVIDLLNSERDRSKAELVLRDDGKGATRVCGATCCRVYDAEEMLALIAQGRKRRATAGTAKNAGSSRSHAVLQVFVENNADTGRRSGSDVRVRRQGVLTLVDCAGSERKEDSESHNSARVKESAEINASLHALKECMRAVKRSKNSDEVNHVPYRSNNLTKVLHESFVSSHAMLAVIATISPTATDTEHSICTLQTVHMMAGGNTVNEEQLEVADLSQQADNEAAVRLHPSKWSHDDLVDWIAAGRFGKYFGYLRFSNIDNDENCSSPSCSVAGASSPARVPLRQRGVKSVKSSCANNKRKCNLPSAMDGKQLCRWPEAKFTTVLCDNNVKLGRALHNAFRTEMTKADEAANRKRQQNKNQRLSLS